MGNRVEAEYIYLNTYTINELFGQTDAKSSFLKEGLICSTLKSFKSESDLNIVHLVGEVFKLPVYFALAKYFNYFFEFRAHQIIFTITNRFLAMTFRFLITTTRR